MENKEVEHSGVLGMKWGQRRAAARIGVNISTHRGKPTAFPSRMASKRSQENAKAVNETLKSVRGKPRKEREAALNATLKNLKNRKVKDTPKEWGTGKKVVVSALFVVGGYAITKAIAEGSVASLIFKAAGY